MTLMSAHLTRLGLVFAMLLVCAPHGHLLADYIEFKNGAGRQYGLVVSESESQIEMLIFTRSSEPPNKRAFPLSTIKQYVKTIDAARLRTLKENDLVDYRDYGEELASQLNDPVARRFAIRLFAICLAKGDGLIQESAASNLPALANSPKQKRMFESLAFVYGTRIELVLEKPSKKLNRKEKSALLELIRLLRKDQFRQSAQQLNDEMVRPAIALVDRVSQEEIDRAIMAKRVDPELRVKLLQLEYELTSESGQPSDFDSLSQPEIFDIVPAEPMQLPILEAVFDFDLEATHFDNGEWIRPKS